uniref:Tubulin binding cofactor C-like domain-containing protein n=1 Tax=Clastoptera arizonana TaxID=38151 RepID=A0A1B6D388_9HEMI
MGFIFSKCTKKIERNGENSLLKKYSWDDKKSVVDPSDYILNELLNKEAWKLPGDINGEQIVIKNCTNTLIYVLDHINMVTIDDCIGCKIITGPVKEFRSNCTVVIKKITARDTLPTLSNVPFNMPQSFAIWNRWARQLMR